MKIVLYCPNKPLSHPNPSGDLIIAQGIKSALEKMGHECQELVQFRSRLFWNSQKGWFNAIVALWTGLQRTLEFRPDLWLTYHSYYKSPDTIGPCISKLMQIPYVLFQPIYGTRRRRQPENRIGFYINRIALKSCCHAFVNNKNDLEALNRIVPLARTTYLPPGIFPEEFKRSFKSRDTIRARYAIPSDLPVILTACRMRDGVKFRSITYLLHSLVLLKEKDLKFVLMVVGDGPRELSLRILAEKLLPGLVLFTGKIARSEMFRYYSAADIFAFPGIGESLGMVFLEAQACGLPVLALEGPGISQVVDKNRTAILVPEDGGLSMGLALEKLVCNKPLREMLGSNGVSFVREHRNLNRNYAQLSGILQHIVQCRR